MPVQHHREKTFIICLWNMRTRVTNDFLIHWLQGECLWAWEGYLSEMTACRESLVFLKHAILALVFVLSTHALKRETLKPSTVKVDFLWFPMFILLVQDVWSSRSHMMVNLARLKKWSYSSLLLSTSSASRPQLFLATLRNVCFVVG